MISKFFTEKEVSGVFGFDLGTTNSVVTTFTSEGLPTPLVTDSGSITPSCVQFCKNGSIKIGKEAYNNKHLPEVVYSFKKYMGTQYCFKIPGGGEKTAKEVSTIFVREMMSQVYMHQPELVGIKDIVISTPAYFNINQTGDTKSVFTDLGYNVIAIQPEPTSAALVFQTLKNLYEDVLVFDLGGGTFDAVYIRNQNGFPKDSIRLYENAGYNLPELERLLEVVDISGDNALGGDNIDELAVKYYKKENKQCGFTDRELLLAAESAKITGSKSIIVSADKTGVFKYDYAEKATIEIMDRCMKIVNQLLRRNCITKIHCVLCGGSTKSKYIRDYLSKYYSISTEIDPDLAVAIGDGLAAKFMKEGSRVPVVNKMAKYFGIMLKDRFKPILNKCDIVPIAGTIFVENVVPFTNKIHVEFIQTEDLLSSYTPVYSLELNDLQGFDENGRASIRIDVTVTIDGVVSLKAANGDKVVSAVLNSIANEKSQDEAESFYLQRFRNAVKKYGFEDLNPRLEELSKNSSNRTLIKEIDRAIRSRVKSLESSF